MKRLQLNNNQYTLVDDDVFEYLSQWKWSLSSGYAKRQIFLGMQNGKRVCKGIFLHRFLMDAPPELVVDHINRNTLDNRRENLRVCTRSQNQHNRKISKRNKSGVNGVYWHKQRQKWHAQIMFNRRKISLGLFDSVKSARAAVSTYENSMENIWCRENL